MKDTGGTSAPGIPTLEDFWGAPLQSAEPQIIHKGVEDSSAAPRPREIDSTILGGFQKTRLSESKPKKKKNVRKRVLTLEQYLSNPLLEQEPRCPMLRDAGQCLQPPARRKGPTRRVLPDIGDGRQSRVHDCQAGHRFVEYHLADEYNETGVEVLLKVFAYTGYLTQALDTGRAAGLKASYYQAGWIVRYVVKLLTHLEEVWEPLKLPVSELGVDEQYQSVKRKKGEKDEQGSYRKDKKRKRLRPHQWPVVVYNTAFR
ncbi:MAG TPA: hypothetical protein VGR56_06330 [Nitrososphaerales archaeon]|nr:hypothetical protein [Nitrososphaerales archaeon]